MLLLVATERLWTSLWQAQHSGRLAGTEHRAVLVHFQVPHLINNCPSRRPSLLLHVALHCTYQRRPFPLPSALRVSSPAATRAPTPGTMSDSSDFAELLWENGQAVVHARTRKQPPQQQAAFPPFTFTCSSRAQQRQPVAAPLPKTGGGLFADFSSAAAAGLDATRDNGDLDDTVPWINYPIPIVEEASPAAAAAPALADTFIPDFFSELHAAAAAATSLGPLPPPPPPPPVQHTGDHHDDNRSTPVPSPTTGRGPEPSKETHRAPLPGPAGSGRPEPHGPQAELAPARKPRPESGAGEGLMNFSIFSRPAAMARASLRQRPPQTGTADKASNNATTSTRVESTVLQSASGPRTATAPAVFVDQRMAWPSQQPKDVRFPCAAAAPPPPTSNLQQERPSSNNNNNMTPPQKEVETRKASEAAGATATSSVCSGNGAAGTGMDDESWRQQKRKSLQAECSASQDDDPDDESGGMRRSCSRGAKRSRTAEVHNLSERRRRDRINEKMRALQELIPNCNKIDKASMLDEAIEYLKTLQLQVQMMSMGSGLCIPPMLLPPAMQQHLQIPPHFPHLGLGMGLGYGMGFLDMNSAAAAVPFPHMPGAHFPCPMIPAAPLPQGLGIGMPARNTMPLFGVPPGQPIQPPFPSLAGLPVRPNLAPPHASSAAMANMVQEQQQQSLNNGARLGASTGGDPQLQTIVQDERLSGA